MSTECKEEVMRDMNRAAHDYRLNWRLNHACEADINGLCAGVCNAASGQPCGGLVLQCLQDKQDNITSAECQEEVGGARMGPQLAAAHGHAQASVAQRSLVQRLTPICLCFAYGRTP